MDAQFVDLVIAHWLVLSQLLLLFLIVQQIVLELYVARRLKLVKLYLVQLDAIKLTMATLDLLQLLAHDFARVAHALRHLGRQVRPQFIQLLLIVEVELVLIQLLLGLLRGRSTRALRFFILLVNFLITEHRRILEVQEERR